MILRADDCPGAHRCHNYTCDAMAVGEEAIRYASQDSNISNVQKMAHI